MDAAVPTEMQLSLRQSTIYYEFLSEVSITGSYCTHAMTKLVREMR